MEETSASGSGETTSDQSLELKAGVESALNRVRQIRSAAEQSMRLARAFAELNALTGLAQVKDEIRKLVSLARVNARRAAQGGEASGVSLHLVFTGNPGTGKTTVARLVGRIYEAAGLLTKGQLVETDRAGLVASYLGQTAEKTSKKIDDALNGVLFIDEAYSLSPRNASRNLEFGDEAISTLLKRMEDDRARLSVIVAGYTDEMRQFIDSNAGLKSRFTRYIEFPDYSADELFEIFMSMVRSRKFALSGMAEIRAREATKDLLLHAGEKFGNARDVRTLFERTLELQASRLEHNHNADVDLSEIKAEDFPPGAGQRS